MAIFHCYVSSPEGRAIEKPWLALLVSHNQADSMIFSELMWGIFFDICPDPSCFLMP